MASIIINKEAFEDEEEEYGESGEDEEYEEDPDANYDPKKMFLRPSIVKQLLKLYRKARLATEDEDELTKYLKNSKLFTSMADIFAEVQIGKKYKEPNFELLEHLYDKLSSDNEPPLKSVYLNLKKEKELLEAHVDEIQNEIRTLRNFRKETVASAKPCQNPLVTPDDKLTCNIGEWEGEGRHFPEHEEAKSGTQIPEIGAKELTQSKSNRPSKADVVVKPEKKVARKKKAKSTAGK